MRELPVITRSCGPCSLCCTTHGIDDMTQGYPDGVKPKGERCVHLRAGRCGIYGEHPTSCKEFRCLWLQGIIPAHLRPDKVRAVLDVNSSGGNIIVVHVLPQDRGAHRKGALGKWIKEKAMSGVSFYIVCGDERHALGPIAEQIKNGNFSVNEINEKGEDRPLSGLEAGRLLFVDALSRSKGWRPARMKTRCLYSLVGSNANAIVIRDDGDGHVMSVTNDAEAVVAQLAKALHGRRLFYYDSEGQLDEILVTKDGAFAGFAPGPRPGKTIAVVAEFAVQG